MKKTLLLNLLMGSILLLSSCASYNSIMRKAVKNSLGKDFNSYSTFSYPTNNFGLITTFENELASENQYCAMAACLDGIDITKKEEWLNLGGLADVGEGGSIKLSEKKKNKISVDAVLPKLWDVLGIEGGIENEREVKTTLNIGTAHVRFLNKKKFEEYIDSLPDNNKYKQKYNLGSLVLIVSDVVVEYMSVKIEVSNKLKTELDAKIEAGQITENIGKIDLSVKIEKISSGTYILTIDKPVIVLRLAKKKRSTEGLISRDNFDDWEVVKDYI